MLGESTLYSVLNISEITDLLDTYNSSPALFAEALLPDDFSGEKSINFYRISAGLGELSYLDILYTAHCRAATYSESDTIANAVYTNANRLSRDGYALYCNILPVVRPADDVDNYNTPVEIRVMQRY